MEQGLDLPIINPNVESMTGAVRAFRVLNGIDKNSLEFINAYNDAVPAAPVKKADSNVDIFAAVYNGLKNEGAAATAKLLETTDAMQVVNEMLIPALDRVGEDFEKNKIFLPQLGDFDVIKKAYNWMPNIPKPLLHEALVSSCKLYHQKNYPNRLLPTLYL